MLFICRLCLHYCFLVDFKDSWEERTWTPVSLVLTKQQINSADQGWGQMDVTTLPAVSTHRHPTVIPPSSRTAPPAAPSSSALPQAVAEMPEIRLRAEQGPAACNTPHRQPARFLDLPLQIIQNPLLSLMRLVWIGPYANRPGGLCVMYILLRVGLLEGWR